jgi:hypothetical protein
MEPEGTPQERYQAARPVFSLAAISGNLEALLSFVIIGLKPTFGSEGGRRLLPDTVAFGDTEAVRLLLEVPGFDPNERDDDPLIIVAIQRGWREMAAAFAANENVRIAAMGKSRLTALDWAVEMKDAELTRTIAERMTERELVNVLSRFTNVSAEFWNTVSGNLKCRSA